MLPLFDIISPVIGKILEFIPSPEKKAEALAKAQQAMLDHEEKIMAALSEQNKSQSEVNAEEAKSTNLFIAGWRPAVGWCCAAAFGWVYLLQPMLTFGLAVIHRPVVLPALDFSQMSTVLMGMLGLAGLRSYEKKTDTEGNR